MMGFKEESFDPVSLAQSRGLDPASVMRIKPEIHGLPYTEKSDAWLNGQVGSSSESLKELVRARIINTCGPKKGKQYWDSLRKKKTTVTGEKQVPILDNPGFAEFLRDIGSGTKEFLDHMQKMPHPIMLLASIGLNADEKEIPTGDLFFSYVCNEPVHSYTRFRASVLVPFLLNEGLEDADFSVVGLGSGYVPELRLIDKRIKKDQKLVRQLPTKIIICDKHPDVARWHADHPSFMMGKVDFHNEDIQTTLLALSEGSQSTIYMTGVASYCVDRLPGLVPLIISKLKPGGNFVFDLQVMDWSLERIIKVLGWQVPGFKPNSNFVDAIELVAQATKGLPLSVKNYYLDPNADHDTPAGVVFRLQKKV